MTITDMTADDYYRYCKVQIDDYLGSIRGLYAFASIVCWDADAEQARQGSRFTVPRRMTVEEDDVPKNLTPDCVVQISERYGIVAEMKKHYRDNDLSALRQIERYDQDLVGWWTPDEKIESHDLVLLCHYFSGTMAQDAYRLWKDRGNSYDRHFAIVEFSYSETAQEWFVLKRIEGTLSDPDLDESLRRVRRLPTSILIQIVSSFKFYDVKPPLIHMLVLIHEYIFPLLIAEEEYDSDSPEGYPVARVTVKDVRNKLEEQFSPRQDKTRQPQIPKTKWVREALEKLVDLKLATKEPQGRDVAYSAPIKKPPKKDAIKYLSKKLYDLERKPIRVGPGAEQLDLF